MSPQPATMPTRRTLAKGAAWSLPVVTVAASAPMLAASQQCAYTTSAWENTGGPTSGTATAANGITATRTLNGSTREGTSYDNMAPTTITNSLLPSYSGSKWLQLATGGSNGSGETVTIAFPQSVKCVEFYVQDIDTQYVSGSSRYRDDVEVTGFTAATVSASTAWVTVSGGTAYPTNNADSANPGNWQWSETGSINGLVKFTAPGPLISITLLYKNLTVGGGSTVNSNNQQVWVSPLKYSTTTTACTC